MLLPDTSAPTPAGPGRRAAAVALNTVLLVAVLAFSVRSIADFKRERIPALIDRATACEVLNREVTTTWCEVRGDLVVYSANSHPVARVVLPPLAVSFANSVVLTWLAGANAGQLLLGLRVRRRADAGRARLSSVLLRWPLWPVAAFGSVVVRHRTPLAPAPVPEGPAPEPVEPDAVEPALVEPATDDDARFSADEPDPMEPVPVDDDAASGSPSPQGS